MSSMRKTLCDVSRPFRKALARRLVGAPRKGGGLTQYIDSEDTSGLRSRHWESLLEQLRRQSVPAMVGGGTNQYYHRVNVEKGKILAVLQVAWGLFGRERVLVRSQGEWHVINQGSRLENAINSSNNLDVVITDERGDKELISTSSPLIVSGLRVEIVGWQEYGGAYNSRYFESNRVNSFAHRLRLQTFQRLTEEQHNFDDSIPPSDIPTFPVDVVYTWVDGSDPEWLKRKQERQSGEAALLNKGRRALDSERFRSRDELKYSLRSLEQFAPWVRTIYIVTDRQCPEWLNTNHPKIRLVDHQDIFGCESWLPTFNSSGIETQLHHISGLSDKFLYFNDDFFLGQSCYKSDFFFGNGVLKCFPSGQMAYEADIDSSSEEYIQADKNAIELISEDFLTVNRQIMQHVPYSSDRNLLQELEDRFPEEFAKSASAPFRSSNCLRPIAFMQYHYGYNQRLVIPSKITHRYLALWKETIIAQLGSLLKSRKYKTFCINDVGLQPERTEEVNEAVVNFLEEYFPVPSEFEK